MRVYVILHELRERADVRLVGVLVVAERVLGSALGVAERLVERRGDVPLVEQRRLARLLPWLPATALDTFFERPELIIAVEVVLQLGDVLLVAVEVSAMVVECLDERGEQRARVGATRIGGKTVDVKEHALRGVPLPRGLHGGGECRHVGDLRYEVVHRALARDLAVLERDREDLQQMRLARAEEARNPRPVAHSVGVVVFVEEAEQVAFHLVGHHELLQLASQMFGLVGLHHGVYRAVDILLEGVFQKHPVSPCLTGRKRASLGSTRR